MNFFTALLAGAIMLVPTATLAKPKYVIECRSSITGAYVTYSYAQSHKATTQCWRTLRR